MGNIHVVVGAQYGSEAKGAVTAWLTAKRRATAVARVAGPNAGHTAYDRQGRKWALRQVPAGMVTSPGTTGVIAAGSEIDLEVLQSEVQELDGAGHMVSSRLIIDPQATIIEREHKILESGLTKAVGSTGKGIGAARADRIMRRAMLAGEVNGDIEKCGVLADTGDYLRRAVETPNAEVVIEGTQGYGLGLHAGMYPKCTSSDCRAIDFLAMAGVSPWQHGCDGIDVWLVARVYPIRVAGNSGPMKGETTWEALGLPEERTTVTQKVRRVGEWDHELVASAVQANGGPSNRVHLALTMLDQVVPGVKGAQDWSEVEDEDRYEAVEWINKANAAGAKVQYIGTSPTTYIEM